MMLAEGLAEPLDLLLRVEVELRDMMQLPVRVSWWCGVRECVVARCQGARWLCGVRALTGRRFQVIKCRCCWLRRASSCLRLKLMPRKKALGLRVLGIKELPIYEGLEVETD